MEENVDEAQRIEVFRLYSEDFIRRNMRKNYKILISVFINNDLRT